MKICILYPPASSSVAIETFCRTLQEAGHHLKVVTFAKQGPLHDKLKNFNISCEALNIENGKGLNYYFSLFRKVLKILRKGKYDVVVSHLNNANFITIFCQYFISGRVVIFRHHAESEFYYNFGHLFGLTRNRNEILADKIINKLAPTIVTPSTAVYNSLVQYENCNKEKVKLVHYIYDFTLYSQPIESTKQIIRKDYHANLLCIMVSRMIPNKQHFITLQVMRELILEGKSIKLLLLDSGPLEKQLKNYVEENGLSEYVYFLGFKPNVIDYLNASDVLVHPSLTEASSNVVKEMALCGNPSIVCKDVGDFNEYLEDKISGYFIDRSVLYNSLKSSLSYVYEHSDSLKQTGLKARNQVVRYFSNTPENKQNLLNIFLSNN